MTFETWMKEADAILNKWFEVDSSCLVDWGWYSAFEDGMTPQFAVECFVEDGVSEGDLPDSFMEIMWEIQSMQEADDFLRRVAN